MKVKGFHKNEVCAVKSVKLPDYSDKISGTRIYIALTVSDDMRDLKHGSNWKMIFLEYINKHSQTEAAKLAGAYAQ